jgi:ketosteroid isomerase-like protein
MYRFVLVLAAALGAVAMYSPGPARAAAPLAPAASSAGMPALPGPLSQTVMQAYTAYLQGDVEGIAALTTDDVEWGGVGPAGLGAPFGDYHGHDGVRRWFQELAASSAPYQLTGLEFHEDADSVWVTGQQSTTFKNGKSEAAPFAHFFKFRDGRIATFWNFTDSAAIVAAAGVAPAGDGMDDETQRNIAGLQAGYAAFATGNLEALRGMFTDDIVWDAIGPAGALPIFGEFQGRAQALAWFQAVGSAMDCEPFRDVKFIASGDTVVAFGMSKATFRATGKVVDTPFVHIARFRDGKMYWFECLEDTAADVMAAH